MRKQHRISIIFALTMLVATSGHIFAQGIDDTMDIRRIWDRADHNAFTDITYFKNKLYVVFREGDGHIPNKDNTGNGIIRVLSSVDGEYWESAAEIKLEGVDLRDPKITATPRNRLMVLMGGSKYDQQEIQGIQTYISTSDPNGGRFSDPEPVEIDERIKSDFDWIWRVTWQDKTGYGVLYQPFADGEKGKTKAYLVSTNKQGKEYELVTELDIEGNPSEATIRFFSGGEMVMLVRRGRDQMGMLGTSKAPYTDWEWQELGFELGGPNFDRIPINKILIATRLKDENGSYTALVLGEKGKEFKEVMRLPSGGDTSYAGMFTISGFVWLSYYSSHEEKTSIYFARIPYSKLQ